MTTWRVESSCSTRRTRSERRGRIWSHRAAAAAVAADAGDDDAPGSSGAGAGGGGLADWARHRKRRREELLKEKGASGDSVRLSAGFLDAFPCDRAICVRDFCDVRRDSALNSWGIWRLISGFWGWVKKSVSVGTSQ